MGIILLCPNVKCNSSVPYTLLENEQNLRCGSCGEEFLFFNAGAVRCPACDTDVQVGLANAVTRVQCHECRRELPLALSANGESMVKPWRIENETSWQYCGLHSFEAEEDAMLEGKAFFDNLSRGGWFRPNTARGIYLSLIKFPVRQMYVRNVRFVHGYCNFKWYESHENAKFMSFINPKPISDMLGRLTKEKGLVDIWIKGEELHKDLSKMLSLAAYRSRFKLTV